MVIVVLSLAFLAACWAVRLYVQEKRYQRQLCRSELYTRLDLMHANIRRVLSRIYAERQQREYERDIARFENEGGAVNRTVITCPGCGATEAEPYCYCDS